MQKNFLKKKKIIMIIFFVIFVSKILAEQPNVLIILMDDLGESLKWRFLVNFLTKISILVKNLNFGQKYQFWLKI